MGLRFSSFASGSTGNSYLVRSDTTAILIDCGIAGKRIVAGLDTLGLTLRDINAILLTHEHSDHILSIKMMARKAENAQVYATKGTFGGIDGKVSSERMVRVVGGEGFTVGDIKVDPFDLSHDASEPVGYSLTFEGRKLTLLTDTGIVTDKMVANILGSDAMILEANHEVDVLKAGPYPYVLKQRILGKFGHLSNDTAAWVVAKLLKERDGKEDEKPPYVMLAHISRHNNTPDMAYVTVKNALFEEGYMVDKDVQLSVAPADEVTPEIEV